MNRIKNIVIGCLAGFLISAASSTSAATIKDGTILYSPGSYTAGEAIPLGVDSYGYNYNARSFSGSYFNAYANGDGLPPYTGDDAAYLAANPTAATHWAWAYRDAQLAMKWNDAWLSNKDEDGDGKLDRHLGSVSYVGSGAWISNHMSGEYEQDGKNQTWNDFVKIVAAPSDAVKNGGTWFAANGNEIGPVIWTEFAVVQEVYNDTGSGDHGILSKSPAGPGVGKY